MRSQLLMNEIMSNLLSVWDWLNKSQRLILQWEREVRDASTTILLITFSKIHKNFEETAES